MRNGILGRYSCLVVGIIIVDWHDQNFTVVLEINPPHSCIEVTISSDMIK